MLSSITSNKTLNRSRSITEKSFPRDNKSFNDVDQNANSSLIHKSNYTNNNFDNKNINKYSEYADDQKNYINDLLRKLQMAKEDRKQAEKNSKILEHRVVLLMNQEKLAVKKFESTKTRLEQMVQNRKFINEEHKLKCLLQMRKKEEIEQLKEKAEQQRKNRLKTKDLSINNTTKDRSLNRSMNRVNTSKSPIHYNLYNNSPEKPSGRLNNSKSSSRILENSFAANRSFSQNNSKLFSIEKKTFNYNKVNKINDSKLNESNYNLNNTISVINNNANNILNSKIVFGDEGSVNTKGHSNLDDNNNEYYKNNASCYNKNSVNNNNLSRKDYISKQKNSEESGKERKNTSIINKNTGAYTKQEKKINVKKTENSEKSLKDDNESLNSQNHGYSNKNKNIGRFRNISCDANSNNNIKIINLNESSKIINNKNENKYESKLNSIRVSSAIHNKTDKSQSTRNNLNQSIDSKKISQSKHNQISNNNNNINNDFKQNVSILDNKSENSKNLNQHLEKNTNNNNNIVENKESLSYKLYNELKNVKKNLNVEKTNNLRRNENSSALGSDNIIDESLNKNNNDKNSRNNLSKSKSTERFSNRENLNNTLNNKHNSNSVFMNIQNQTAKSFSNQMNIKESNKGLLLNSSVGFTAKNDKVLSNIIDNINRNYKNNNSSQSNKNKNSPDIASKNSVNYDYDAELEKEILDSYKQPNDNVKEYKNNSNTQFKHNKNKSKENQRRNIIDAYTLGRNESYPIEEESSSTYDDKRQINSNDYISKISCDKNTYKRELDITKASDVKQQKKALKKQNAEMIKKMKEVCLKNKILNQNELAEEDQRKKRLDDKKSKLRSEILKQIDEDEKQKSILEEELKKAEQQQKNLINKQMLFEDINQFHNKDFINENNFSVNSEKGSYSELIYKKARPETAKNSNYNYNYSINNY